MMLVQQINRARDRRERTPPTPVVGRSTTLEGGELATGPSAPLPEYQTEEVGHILERSSRYRSLLVPLDGSAFGEHALPLALAIARRAGASVRLVHVSSAQERQREQVYLDGLLRRLEQGTDVPVRSLLREGREVAPTLCEVAKVDTDLVVMATHQRGLPGRLWHGGISDALMRQLKAPLLLVRGSDAPVDLTGAAVPRNFLIPLDGSKSAEQVLGPALALGTLTGADHTVLRVLQPQVDSLLGYGGFGARARPPNEAWHYIRRLAQRLGDETARVHPRVLIAEEPIADSVLWYAEKQEADCIALATRGGGTLSRLFCGSVADRVVRRATTPVLVVRVAE